MLTAKALVKGNEGIKRVTIWGKRFHNLLFKLFKEFGEKNIIDVYIYPEKE